MHRRARPALRTKIRPRAKQNIPPHQALVKYLGRANTTPLRRGYTPESWTRALRPRMIDMTTC